MQNEFTELGISPAILKAIDEMGFIEPTEVQSQAIPSIFNHQDVIVMSKTGSGKTAVFGIPMLQMTDPADPGPQGLILTPTRELAVQIDSDFKLMSRYLEHQTTVVYGQHSMNVEVQALKKGTAIVVGTPGRVFDHLRQGNLVTKHIRFLVLDEADRMLDMGFLYQVVRIIRTLPKNRITLLFSATIPPEVQRISRDFMNNPVMIEIESQTMTVDTVRQIYYRVFRNEKMTQLNRVLLHEQPESCMIFCNTRYAVDNVQSFLNRKGYFAQSLHGDIPQAKRTKTIEQFKQGVFHILVATDVAARGLHIDDLSLVINYDVPLEKDGYVHRIGRTGRAGKEGLAITLVTSEDIMSLYSIEEHTGAMIREGDLPTEEMLDSVKEGAASWIQANSNRSAAAMESSDDIASKTPRNDRRNPNASASGSTPARSRSTGPSRVSKTAGSSDRPKLTGSSISSAPSPRAVTESKPQISETPQATPQAPYSSHSSKMSPSPRASQIPRASQASLAPQTAIRSEANMPVHRRPHVRIIGGSSEDSSETLKASMKIAPKKDPAMGATPIKAPFHKSPENNKVPAKTDKDSDGTKSNSEKPWIAKIFGRFFKK